MMNKITVWRLHPPFVRSMTMTKVLLVRRVNSPERGKYGITDLICFSLAKHCGPYIKLGDARLLNRKATCEAHAPERLQCSRYRMLRGHKYLRETRSMTAQKVLFDCLHVTELYMFFFSPCWWFWSQSSQIQPLVPAAPFVWKEEKVLAALVIKKMGGVKRKQKLFLKMKRTPHCPHWVANDLCNLFILGKVQKKKKMPLLIGLLMIQELW